MKTKKILLAAVIMLITGAIFYSCQKEQTQTPVLKVETNILKSVGCVSTFSADNAVEVYNNPTFFVSITAWNDATTTYVKLTRTGGTGTMTVRAASPGLVETQTTGPTILDAGSTVTYPVTNPENWSCGDAVTFSFYISGLGGGSSNKFQTGIITYFLSGLCTTSTLIADPNPVCVNSTTLITASVTASETVNAGEVKIMQGTTEVASGLNSATYTYTPTAAGTVTFTAVYDGTGTSRFCSSESAPLDVVAEVCGCTESFAYVLNADGTYTFTYTSAIALSNATVKFTFPQIDEVVWFENYGFTQVGQGNSSVYQKTMNFDACIPVSWTVTFIPDCVNNSGEYNVWTDFKVDDVSKKTTSTPNIRIVCP